MFEKDVGGEREMGDLFLTPHPLAAHSSVRCTGSLSTRYHEQHEVTCLS